MDSKRKPILIREAAGFLILMVLLAGGLLGSRSICRHYDGIACLLDAASCASDRQTADACWTEGRRRWEKSWHISCVIADHSPMEDIDTLFARIAVYAAEAESTEFSASCAEAARRMKAMADAQRFSWWNLF